MWVWVWCGCGFGVGVSVGVGVGGRKVEVWGREMVGMPCCVLVLGCFNWR